MLATPTNKKAKTAAEGKPHRADAAPGKASPEPNPVWQSLALSPLRIQPKLTVSQPGDPYEQEADHIADRVMRMATPPSCHNNLSFTSADSLKAQAKCDHRGDEEERELQRKEQRSDALPPAIVPTVVREALNSPGQLLDPNTRSFMEERFDHDFAHVHVHSDARAAASAQAVDANAYTVGSDIVFGPTQFAPDSAPGRKLLAHELTHVVQQQQGASVQRMTLQRKVNAIRFQDEPTLNDISEGKKVLKEGDKGEAVIRTTTALAELGHYTNPVIDESFDPPLTSAVSKYQDAKALKGKAVVGTVDKPTFEELDKDFSASYKVERDVIGKQTSADPLKGTQSLDDAERTASDRAISTEVKVNPVTGLPPTFVPDIKGKGTYEDRLHTIVKDEIVSQYNAMGKDREVLHADPKNLYDWTQTEIIAGESKSAADKVFGEYKKGPALKKGVNIFDAWEDKVNQLKAGGKAKEDSSADWRVQKILTGDDAVKKLDKEHGAIQSRAAEQLIVDKVKADLVKTYRMELIETHKGWPGYASGGKIFIQIFKQSSNAANKWNMWDFFQTFIHEYIHTLEHPDHVAFRSSKGEQKGNFTLREGATDYFTKIVWNSITIDDALRKKIEGPLNDPLKKFSIQDLNTYDESENAERLAGVVGIRNLAAAFFLGKVELIGKK